MDNLIESFLKDIEKSYPKSDEETTQESFLFMLAKKNLETVLFPQQVTDKGSLPAMKYCSTKKGCQQERAKGLLARIERDRNRPEVTELHFINQVERYQIIVRLRTLQALKTDKKHWAYRRLEALIQRIDNGELPQAEASLS